MSEVIEPIKETQNKIEGVLRRANVDLPKLESQILLAHVLKIKTHDLYVREDDRLTTGEYDQLKEMVLLKKAGMPTAYLTGSKEFFGRELFVNSNTLIPRPETEELVELVLKRHSAAGVVLDLGCGSGCIGLTLALEMSISKIVLSDVSRLALQVSQLNYERLLKNSSVDTSLVQSDLFDSSEIKREPFDLVVSNPPYIPPEEMEHLMPAVRKYEPEIALKIPDPDFPKRLIGGAFLHLKKGGWLYLENHFSQIRVLIGIMREAGFRNISVQKDLSGKDRFVYGRK